MEEANAQDPITAALEDPILESFQCGKSEQGGSGQELLRIKSKAPRPQVALCCNPATSLHSKFIYKFRQALSLSRTKSTSNFYFDVTGCFPLS